MFSQYFISLLMSSRLMLKSEQIFCCGEQYLYNYVYLYCPLAKCPNPYPFSSPFISMAVFQYLFTICLPSALGTCHGPENPKEVRVKKWQQLCSWPPPSQEERIPSIPELMSLCPYIHTSSVEIYFMQAKNIVGSDLMW